MEVEPAPLDKEIVNTFYRLVGGTANMRFRTTLLSTAIAVTICTGCFASSMLISYGSARDFAKCILSHARYDKAAGGVVFDGAVASQPSEEDGVAVIETPVIFANKPYDEMVPSWNSTTPDGSYVVVKAKALIGGVWTRWYNMELYDVTGKPEPKKSFGESDDIVRCASDTLEVRNQKTADAVKVRFELHSADGKTYPTLRFAAVNMNDPAGWQAEVTPVKSVWGKELDVPYLCQLSEPGGNVWCSATSTAMVLQYWSKQLNRPEMNIGITESAKNCKDNRWGGTGHWSFNTAYAGEFKGMRGVVDRFSSVSQIERWIARGIPVIVSLDYTRLNRRNSTKITGHLMVIRGFTKDGDPVFNDPWARLEKGEKLRKVFKRADLEYAWLGPDGSYGTVYLMYPEDRKTLN